RPSRAAESTTRTRATAKRRRRIRCTGRSRCPSKRRPTSSRSRSTEVHPGAGEVRGFPVEVSPEAAAAHDAALVLDLHNDLLTKLTHMPGYDFTRAHAPAAFYNPLRLDLDLPRIRRGGIDALGCLMFAGFRFDKS